ncbi:unnamed protein product [Clonostachys rosea]|uniref:Uncharacterized protein n=1 Tax=Bionectria ochroleuca TaxID=29856 RepID=A0ABY6V3L5_BIOOC|nr:unnamed protein product [Clonostachys rosea]
MGSDTAKPERIVLSLPRYTPGDRKNPSQSIGPLAWDGVALFPALLLEWSPRKTTGERLIRVSDWGAGKSLTFGDRVTTATVAEDAAGCTVTYTSQGRWAFRGA